MTTPHYQDGSIRVYHGDCREVLATLPGKSIDAVVTSPPYAEQRKSTYGGVPESEFPAWTVRWMDPLRRVLKPAGSVMIVIRPHIRDGVLSDYILRTRLAVRDAGWAELDELIWFKRDAPPLGRVGRPRRAWESILWFGHNGAAWCDPKANGTPSKHLGFEYGRAMRYGWDHEHGNGSASITEGIARCTDVAELLINDIPKDGDESAHPAPFPPKLAAWCVRLACPPGGTVCDPFVGSGSTGIAAIQEGRQFVGIDIEETYVVRTARRLAKEPLTLSGGALTA
jgi:site-specific DNA-methyltransferase (adenine-specific)